MLNTKTKVGGTHGNIGGAGTTLGKVADSLKDTLGTSK